jgi:PAS domain S-box-containing protein
MINASLQQATNLVDSVGIGLATVDRAGVQSYVNPAFCHMTGFQADELLGRHPPYPYWPPEELGRIQAAFNATLAGEAPEQGVELRFCRKDGTRFDVMVSVTPIQSGEGWIAAVTRITPHARTRRGQSLLIEAGTVLGASLDYEATLRSLAHLCVPALADYCLIDLLREAGEIERVEISHRDQRRVSDLWEMSRRWPAQMSDGSGIGYVLRERQPVLASVVTDEMLTSFTKDPERLAMLRAMEVRSCIIVPMIARDRVLGAVTLNSSSSERIFAESDLEMAVALAERAAVAVDNARLFNELQTQMRGREILEADLGLALKAGGFGYWTYDVASGVVTWDPKYREIFGLSAHEAPTFEAGISAVHADDRKRVAEAIASAAQNGEDYHEEFRAVVAGNVRWIMARGRGFRGGDGAIVRMAGFVLDITERVQSENRWRNLSGRLDLALSHSGLGDWSWDASTDLVRFSTRAAELFGIPVEPSMTWTEMRTLLHPADAEMAAQAVTESLLRQSEYHIEYRVRSEEAGYRWIEARGRGIYQEGEAVGMIGTVQDVTARRREQETANILAQAGSAMASLVPQTILEELVSLCVQTLGDYALAYVVEADGSIVPVVAQHSDPALQPIAAELAEVSRPRPGSDHLVARAITSALPVFIPRASQEIIEATATSARHLELLRILRPAGAVAVPLIARGRTFAVLAVARGESGLAHFTDDDMEVVAELAQRAALAVDNAALYQQAQTANAVKAQFLATISHELRTPLNAIIGYTELLEVGIAGEMSEEQQGYLSRVKSSAAHQLRLVEDVLSFARLDAGKPQITIESLEVSQLFAEVQSIIAPAANRKGLTLAFSCSAPITIESDRGKLRQVLLNIVSNAIKFSQAGEIRTTAALENGILVVEIADQGIGIPADKHDAIFQPFFQVDQSNTREAGGAGLGLSIARRFVGLLSGTIAVTSSPGAGATFTIRLPTHT